MKFYALLCFDSSPVEWERLLRFSRRSIILEGQYRTKSPVTASQQISHSFCRGRRYRASLIDPNQLPDKMHQNIWENWVTRRVPSLQTNHYPLVSASLINEPPPALSVAELEENLLQEAFVWEPDPSPLASGGAGTPLHEERCQKVGGNL